MPRRIIIHAGFHKTGTSLVQQVLRENRRLLHSEMVMRLKGQMQELMHASRGYSTWRDDLTLIKVLSAEEFIGHMPSQGDLADYSAAPFCFRATAPRSKPVFQMRNR